jgi:MarR family transcriptional regulator, organic hydroperoxide resistance regulator
MMSRMSKARRPDPVHVQSLDPALDFMRLLWGIEHGLQSTSKRMEARLGITGPQRLVLRIVSQFPGVSPGELARIVRLHPSTITGVVQRLVTKGFLAREQDPADSRRIRLRLREGAKKFTQRPGGTVEGAIARALARVPRTQMRHARQVLSAIAVTLEDSRQ